MGYKAFTLLIFVQIPVFVFAQNSVEISCRSKAKEAAVSIYSDCMTEARQAHIQEIRQEYQSKLKELKSFYDDELKKMSGGNGRQTPVTQQTVENQSIIKLQQKPKKSKSLTERKSRSNQKQYSKAKQNQVPTQLPEKETSTNAVQNQYEENGVDIPSPTMENNEISRDASSDSNQYSVQRKSRPTTEIDHPFGQDEAIDLQE